ncbi:hypothetical protein FRB97_001858, partial [Tulasnella sp. 331]
EAVGVPVTVLQAEESVAVMSSILDLLPDREASLAALSFNARAELSFSGVTVFGDSLSDNAISNNSFVPGVLGPFIVPDTLRKYAQFISAPLGSPKDISKELFVILIGGNDGFVSAENNLNATRTITYSEEDVGAGTVAIIEWLVSYLQNHGSSGIKVSFADLHRVFGPIFADPSAFGFAAGSVTLCVVGTLNETGYSICSTDPTLQDKHVSWDSVHLTGPGHEVFKNTAYDALLETYASKSIATGAMATAVLNVSTPTPTAGEASMIVMKGQRPAHHLNDQKNSFHNPWDSFRVLGLRKTLAQFPSLLFGAPPIPKDIETRLKKQTPMWGLTTPGGPRSTSSEPKKIKSTWLGHACFLLELPAPETAERDPPCRMNELPPIDIIIISHNHHDHLDTATLTTLEKTHAPHIFAPLGNDAYFQSIGIPTDRTHIMDWWEARDVTVGLPSAADKVEAMFTVSCTPCQHLTGRGIFDRCKTLWASWVIEDRPAGASVQAPGVKCYFAGDTGYRAVRNAEEDDDPTLLEKLPVCPEFKRIGEKFEGFDLAFIPIGAYSPRDSMSPTHCAPKDSVRLFQDVKARRAIGMHWGTWVLTLEPVMDPPKVLEVECKKAGIPEGAFNICGLGETVF